MKRDIVEASGQFLDVLLEQHQNVPLKVMGAALELIATLNAHRLSEVHERQSHLRTWTATRKGGDYLDPSDIRVAG